MSPWPMRIARRLRRRPARLLLVAHHEGTLDRVVRAARALERRRRVSAALTVHPYHVDEAWGRRRAGSLSLPFVPSDEVDPGRFDLVVAADHHATTMWPARSVRVLLAHAPASSKAVRGSSSSYLQRPESLERGGRALYDRILVAGTADREAFQPSWRWRVHIVGDPLLDLGRRAKGHRLLVHRALGAAPGERLLLVAPSWDGPLIDPSGLEAVARCTWRLRGDWRVVLKPHPIRSGISEGSGGPWRTLPARRRVEVLAAAADALLTDRSSSALSAGLLGTPVVLWPDDAPMAPDSPFDRLRRCLPKPRDVAEVAACVEGAVRADPAHLAPVWRRRGRARRHLARLLDLLVDVGRAGGRFLGRLR